MRHKLAIALASASIAVAIAAGIGWASGAPTERSGDPSTFNDDPDGASGLRNALRRLGIDASQFIERPIRLVPAADSNRTMFAVLAPPGQTTLSPPEVRSLIAYSRHADVLLAGSGAESAMRCFGYHIVRRPIDSIAILTAPTLDQLHGALVPTGAAAFTDSSRRFDLGDATCAVPAVRAITVINRTPRGVEILRLDRADVPHAVFLAADAAPFANAELRQPANGIRILQIFAGRYRHVIFDEYHHGHGTDGSLFWSTVDWSRHSAWGVAIWQVAAVGLLALLAGAVRFGRPRAALPRARRSSLEHVRALATALSAARGHDEAIAATIRGLRRRLTPPGLRPRGDYRQWLATLADATSSQAQRARVARLAELTTPGQPAASVTIAANIVEDLWQNMRP